ncbi:MAG: Sec-independent protein translocase TatA [Flavobacterium sp.]|nr:MAG: Sec-independent protein translocase TatA [Flavobacterium sp.]
MFGIGGGEFLFIMIVVLMFFGSDKIPEIARTLGKGIAQLKNATNEIKSDIQKGMNENGIDHNSLTGGIAEEINKAKEGFTKMVNESNSESAIKSELDQIRENFSKLNTDLNPEAREFNPESEPKPEIAAEPAKNPIIDIPEDHDGPIKRQM